MSAGKLVGVDPPLKSRTHERIISMVRDRAADTLHCSVVTIRSFSPKALKQLYEAGIGKGLPPGTVTKLRAMFAVLDQMKDVEELKAWPLWNVHRLAGDRKGVWSLHVTRNWRLTFAVEDSELVNVDFEDYH